MVIEQPEKYWLIINQGHDTEVPPEQGEGNVIFDPKEHKHILNLNGDKINISTKGIPVIIYEN
jgi:hypothetical protein